MIKSNLLETLRKFSSTELKDFGEYVRSPFFNKNESTIKLYDYLRKFAPSFNDKKLEKEYTYNKIFEGANYNDGFMRTIMFNLSKLAEDYLAYTKFKKSEIQKMKNLLYELNERELDKLFEKSMKEVNIELLKKHTNNAEFYFNQYVIEDENLTYLTKIQFHKNEKFIKNTGVENIFNNLTYFYLIRILKFYIYALNVQSIYHVQFKTKVVDDILSNINLEIYQDVPLIKIYYLMMMLHHKENEEQYYRELRNMVPGLDEIIESEDFGETLINLENYCRRKIRRGNKNFLKELFELYKIELDKKTYFLNKKMPHKFYRGLVEIGLKLSEFEWVKSFIEDYKHEMYPEFRDNTYYYALALYHFATGEFDESLRISSKVKYDDIYQKLELKCLTLALYYELNMQEQLFASIDAFRHFLSNDTLVPLERKEGYNSFLKAIKKLIKLRNGFSPYELDELKNTVITDKSVSEEWLLEKIEELTRKN